MKAIVKLLTINSKLELFAVELNSDKTFNILGKISRGATTVVDGDDIEIEINIECPKCSAERNEGFCPFEWDCEIEDKQPIAYVICKCCGKKS